MKRAGIYTGILLYLGILIFFGLCAVSFAETIIYTYDDLHRLKTIEYDYGLVVEYAYDEVGNRTERVVTVADVTPPVVTASVAGGTYNTPKTVALTCTDAPGGSGCAGPVYYSTDEGVPSLLYQGPLTISTTTRLRYAASDRAGNTGAGEQFYTIDTLLPVTTASLPGGVYHTAPLFITLTANEAATIYYSFGPIEPGTIWSAYSTPLGIAAASATLNYYAVDSAGNSETPITTQTYSITFPIAASAGQGGAISNAGTSWVPYGSGMAYDITPDPTYRIADVQVNGASAGPVGHYDFSNVTADQTIAASFMKTYTLTTAVEGILGGTGTITSAPSGINCGTSCSQTYDEGSAVELTATPAPDSEFYCWVSDIPVTGDWSGTGISRAGVFNGGRWWLDLNGNAAFDDCPAGGCYSFGQPDALPVTGDWNGDGRTEIGAFRNGVFALDYNGNGVYDGATVDRLYFLGRAGDIPVTGDWNGGGTAKIGIFREGLWYLDTNGDGVIDVYHIWGTHPGDLPVTADWNGAGRTKVGAVQWGLWLMDYNGNWSWDAGIDTTGLLGTLAGDMPVTGDWNGDQKGKIGMFRRGVWYLDINGNGSFNPGIDTAFTYAFTQSVPAQNVWTVPMTVNRQVSAKFKIKTYQITASAGAGGSISPSGTVTVTHGANQTFQITANGGYHIVDVVVDGVSVGAVSSYTFSGVTAAHSITASFAANAP